MKVLYLETSSMLAWLFNETSAAEVLKMINRADLIVTSELLKIEGMRIIHRNLKEKLLTEYQHDELLDYFYRNLKSWFVMSIDEAVVERASEPFPVEPVRSLDAIHLATAMEYKKLYPQLEVTSQDKRILDNIDPLGLSS